MISVDDPLPYPLKDKSVNIHMTDKLSSELILGTDFLKDHGAIVSMRSNKVIFLPDEFFAVSLHQKPIVCEAFASIIENDDAIEDLSNYNLATYALQPLIDTEILHMDQRTFHVQIITNNPSMIFKTGATIMLTSGFAPQPQIPDGLYLVEDDNTIKVTVRNSATATINLKTNRPIRGLVAHDLKFGYHEPMEISKDTLRALFLKEQTVKAAKMAGVMPGIASSCASTLASEHPDYCQPTPEEYVSSVTTMFEQPCALLQASGLDPPGSRAKPKQAASLAVRRNLLSQFDVSGIEEEWVEQYIKLIMDNWDIFSLNKYNVGHTPHWEHKIESTSSEPVYVKQFKIAIGDEEALDEMSTHLTAARILIQQPSDHNTPIFMVTKRGGPNPGAKRFVQDFRKRNAASKDVKYTIRDVRESLVAVGRLKPQCW